MQDSVTILGMGKSPGYHEVCEHLDVIMIFEAVLDVTQELKDVKPVIWKMVVTYCKNILQRRI